MTFNEANSVRDRIRDLLTGTDGGWRFTASSDLDRSELDILIEDEVSEALIRLNPDIAAEPDHVDRVLYELGAVILSSAQSGLVKANEDLRAWLLGERSMPFGPDGRHVSIRLIDFTEPDNNRYTVSTEVTFKQGNVRRRFDLVLWVNGFPLIVGETKSPSRPSITWADGAFQVSDYEADVTAFFVPNVFSFATEGKELRYAPVGATADGWNPWHASEPTGEPLADMTTAARHLLHPRTVADILADYTVYGTGGDHRKIKIIPRHQQYDTGNRIVERVRAGHPRKGLVWHFQGSGKSLLMLFTARKLRNHPDLGSPTVLIVVDRIDLDTQITGTFTAADVANVVRTESGKELLDWLRSGQRKIIITTVQKFKDAREILSNRSDIICLVDEAHRTQEGDLGRRMRSALPEAFLFGMTGTPINARDRNTFETFGAKEDPGRYLSRYTQADSLTDGATLPLHFQPRKIEFHIDSDVLEAKFSQLTEGLPENERQVLNRRVARMETFVKLPDRIAKICADITAHYTANVAPRGFKAQVVTYDKETCGLYKAELDLLLGENVSEVVISGGLSKKQAHLQRFVRTKAQEEELLRRFRDPDDPLKILIVTAKLLTGFDAPILQTMYLDKVLKDHALLQAICRVNRPYELRGERKEHGLIVDYIGVFSNLARALEFDDARMREAVRDISMLRDELPEAMSACLGFFSGVDRTLEGWEGLGAAQSALADVDTRDYFATSYNRLSYIWKAVSPDPTLDDFQDDYAWLSQVYQSVRPSDTTGRTVWRRLGAQAQDLVNANLSVEAIDTDLETLVLDAELARTLEAAPEDSARRVGRSLAVRLRRRAGNPRFDSLTERLRQVQRAYEAGQLTSLVYLKQLLDLARETVALEQELLEPAEKTVVLERTIESSDGRASGKAALTRLFEQANAGGTAPDSVERIVDEIDRIVLAVRWEGWQRTRRGERDVKRALRKVLYDYQLHRDEELFAKAYDYVARHY
ncbi:type I restriction endonuclease subunit R [Streptosporangium roseum]|uniref:type I restriction endonuclease subunit R n=1 Tax=Streptosporangium roseum TaxID=2001 RepID=UPI0004CDC540|nr:HsdR family type I site-specific deoxyribonuclease [Streptosporangium roseum]